VKMHGPCISRAAIHKRGAFSKNKTKQHHTSPSQNIPHVSSGEDLKQRTNGILNIQLAASTSSEQTSRGPAQTTKQQTPHVVTGEGETNSSCRSINQLSKQGESL
jgi:flagellar hook-basal body complex protein FliE